MAQYFLMKNSLILRLEENQSLYDLPKWIQVEQLDKQWPKLNQDQANYRVVYFREEILDLQNYIRRRKRKQNGSSKSVEDTEAIVS